MATYSLTTINVQGDDQEAFELYADEEKAQTVAFVFDEKQTVLFDAAPDLLEACHAAVEVLECNCGGKCEGSCTKGIVAAAITKAKGKAPTVNDESEVILRLLSECH